MSKAPTHHDDEDAPRRKRRGTSVMAWVLLAMIVGGFGGFGVQTFGGGQSAIGTVGDQEITVNDYARGIQQQVSALSQQFGVPMTVEQVRAFGLDRQVLSGLVSRAALDNEAGRIGLSVGDAVVAAELAGNNSFHGVSGSFDRETYRQTLKMNNMSEADYEAAIRADVARSLLQGAVSGGLVTPDALTGAIFDWAAEKRGFTLLRLTEADLATPLPDATEADLQAWYEAHLADYTRPEAKRIQYVSLLPADLAPAIEITEDAVKAAYDARKDQYSVPEKRLVERLVFGSDDEAKAAMARIEGGETFEALVAERSLTLEDIDLGDVTKADLGPAGDAVFALTGPGVVGPLPSSLGPALFRMNAILAAQETTLDEARAALTEELRLDAARREISARMEEIDDLLAGGATLEDLAKEEGLKLSSTDYAPGAADNDPITQSAAFRKEAEALGEGDFPAAIGLEDGGIVAMQLIETVPPAPRPLADVKEQVAAAFRADALAKALSARAVEWKTAIESGTAMGALGIAERTAAVDRQASIEGAPADLLTAVFQMEPGALRVIEAGDYVAVVRLDQVIAADPETEDGKALRETIAINAARALSQDLFAIYSNAIGAEAGIQLDQAVIDSVNAQLGN